jgi:hypothetical protein
MCQDCPKHNTPECDFSDDRTCDLNECAACFALGRYSCACDCKPKKVILDPAKFPKEQLNLGDFVRDNDKYLVIDSIDDSKDANAFYPFHARPMKRKEFSELKTALLKIGIKERI